ncbi:MAG TPA: LysR family transcriptional regulator [Tepidisphaeraceae bacterium]|nr:LysR family transcriptional regulator [Tepidisphaeraceae bacterium]
MNLNHLAIFHAVAQEGGFSKGAGRLRISQPAVSKQIRELEDRIGLPLVDRSQKGFGLTEAGELLSSYARRIFALEAEAEHALEEMQGLRRGRLAVGASTTIGIYLLPTLFGLYRNLHPNIELNLEIANTDQIQQRLIEHSLQIGLTEGLADNGELEATVLMEDELMVIAPPNHSLLSRSQIAAKELCKQPLIFREQGSGTRVVIERILARKGLFVKPIMSLGSTEAIKRAVAAGIGLGIVSRLTIQFELAAKRLAIVPLADLTFQRPLHLLRPRGQQPEPAAAAFLALLREQLPLQSRRAKRERERVRGVTM